jgi:hypothetical protein
MFWISIALTAWLLGQADAALFTADSEPPPGLLELGDERVELREAPTMAAPVIERITREAADEIRLVRVRVVTRVAGRLRSLSAEATVAGADFGDRRHIALQTPGVQIPSAEVTVPDGEEITYLQESPGGCYVSIGGRVIDAMPCPSGDPRFQLEQQPRVEWWGFLRLSDGRSGWILVARHGA